MDYIWNNIYSLEFLSEDFYDFDISTKDNVYEKIKKKKYENEVESININISNHIHMFIKLIDNLISKISYGSNNINNSLNYSKLCNIFNYIKNQLYNCDYSLFLRIYSIYYTYNNNKNSYLDINSLYSLILDIINKIENLNENCFLILPGGLFLKKEKMLIKILYIIHKKNNLFSFSVLNNSLYGTQYHSFKIDELDNIGIIMRDVILCINNIKKNYLTNSLFWLCIYRLYIFANNDNVEILYNILLPYLNNSYLSNNWNFNNTIKKVLNREEKLYEHNKNENSDKSLNKGFFNFNDNNYNSNMNKPFNMDSRNMNGNLNIEYNNLKNVYNMNIPNNENNNYNSFDFNINQTNNFSEFQNNNWFNCNDKVNINENKLNDEGVYVNLYKNKFTSFSICLYYCIIYILKKLNLDNEDIEICKIYIYYSIILKLCDDLQKLDYIQNRKNEEKKNNEQNNIYEANENKIENIPYKNIPLNENNILTDSLNNEINSSSNYEIKIDEVFFIFIDMSIRKLCILFHLYYCKMKKGIYNINKLIRNEIVDEIFKKILLIKCIYNKMESKKYKYLNLNIEVIKKRNYVNTYKFPMLIKYEKKLHEKYQKIEIKKDINIPITFYISLKKIQSFSDLCYILYQTNLIIAILINQKNYIKHCYLLAFSFISHILNNVFPSVKHFIDLSKNKKLKRNIQINICNEIYQMCNNIYFISSSIHENKQIVMYKIINFAILLFLYDYILRVPCIDISSPFVIHYNGFNAKKKKKKKYDFIK